MMHDDQSLMLVKLLTCKLIYHEEQRNERLVDNIKRLDRL